MYILEFELEPFPAAGDKFTTITTHRLAYVLPCKILDNKDDSNEQVSFKEMEGTPIFVHVGVIECAMGRVKTHDRWTIIDRSDDYAHTVFDLDA
jgi:hypothetical protein